MSKFDRFMKRNNCMLPQKALLMKTGFLFYGNSNI